MQVNLTSPDPIIKHPKPASQYSEPSKNYIEMNRYRPYGSERYYRRANIGLPNIIKPREQKRLQTKYMIYSQVANNMRILFYSQNNLFEINRIGANHNIKFARFDGAFHIFVPKTEIFAIQCKSHYCRLPCV